MKFQGENLRRHGDATSSSMKADAVIDDFNVEENDSNTEGAEYEIDAATLAEEETCDEHDAGIKKVTYCPKVVSSDTDTENNSVVLEATKTKGEHADANLSGSDESKNAVSADGDSSMLSTGVGVQRTRDKFFHELPFDKKILLLKRTENLTTVSSADAQKLAAELGAPFRSVYRWLNSKTVRNFTTYSKRLSREKAAVLDDKFAASSDALTEERALLLGYELDLSVCAIRKYFERKKTEAKMEDKQDCSTPTKTENKQDCSTSSKMKQNVCEQRTSDHETGKPIDDRNTGSTESRAILNPLLLVPQCTSSGSNECCTSSSGICLHTRPSSNDSKNQCGTSSIQSSSCSEKKSLKKKRFVLTLRQRNLLKQHFQISPFIAPADASLLAADLGLPVKAVQLWFHRKRMEKNQADNSETMGSSDLNDSNDQSAEETSAA